MRRGADQPGHRRRRRRGSASSIMRCPAVTGDRSIRPVTSKRVARRSLRRSGAGPCGARRFPREPQALQGRDSETLQLPDAGHARSLRRIGSMRGSRRSHQAARGDARPKCRNGLLRRRLRLGRESEADAGGVLRRRSRRRRASPAAHCHRANDTGLHPCAVDDARGSRGAAAQRASRCNRRARRATARSRSTCRRAACARQRGCSTACARASRSVRCSAIASSAACTTSASIASSRRCAISRRLRRGRLEATAQPVERIAANNVVDGLALLSKWQRCAECGDAARCSP